ncbi:receptor-like serine/threonine-protein kinase SD1-8 isoform X1 [Triticum urartu]|uniref:Receptor-like serine/threonine-protein kinase n=2 Tax=Triticum urartu TaxID=4572 RepID=A0A8R7P2B2_TRIUA|nr:receptor-like serine/threonine-protein kinase SD1-8 isoform X1 [Triticum urartu]
MASHQLRLFQLLLLLLLSSASHARDTISPGQPLRGNDTLVSPGAGSYVLGFFTPPGSNNTYIGLWYAKVPVRTVVWVANRADPVPGPVERNARATLSVSADGTLSVADASSTVVWSAPPAPGAGAGRCTARLLDIGNLVVSDASGAVAWQGFDHPTDTLIPGMRVGMDFRTGANMTLTAWTSPSDPSPGPVVAVMDTTGDPEVFIWNGAEKVWRSGPWDGLQFTGVPDTATYMGFNFSFVNSAKEVSYSFQVANSSIVSRLALNSTGAAGGLLQRWTWVWAAGAWNMYWYAPKDQCDAVNQCGPNGVCDPNSLPVCECLRGFAPRSPEAWALRDNRGGCARATPLDCGNGTDGFALMAHAKVPDTTAAVVDYRAGLAECAQRCQRNCSCTAYANANLSGAPGHRGCVMWGGALEDLRVFPNFGQDLYVRLAAADLDAPSKSDKKAHVIITVAVSICVLAAIIALAGFFWWRRKRARARQSVGAPSKWSGVLHSRTLTSEGTSHGADLDLPIYDLETIAEATQGFSTDNKLGEGGYGPVYKGMLEDGQEIAVKTLSQASTQGPDEFKNEVMLIAKLQHRNLVRLIGCCICGQEKILIYEYMANKSLDFFLFDKSKSMLLDWQTRYRIIEGIARGLLYLHQDSRYRIVHRDLKTSNILLDKDMTPKISDFGMARIFGGDDSEINTLRVVGTYGYMAPEYAMDGVFSVKSDVFSFGVIVLEIITGIRNRGVYSYSSHLNLLAHAWSLLSEGKSLELVDETLKGTFESEEVVKCLKVGLLCVQENPDDRPLMSQALTMLAAADAASLATPKQPGFAARRAAATATATGTEDTSSSRADCSFVDSMTITMIEGREKKSMDG